MDASHIPRIICVESGIARVLMRNAKGWTVTHLRKGDSLEVPPLTWLEVYPETGAKYSVTAGEVKEFATFLRILRGANCNASANTGKDAGSAQSKESP